MILETTLEFFKELGPAGYIFSLCTAYFITLIIIKAFKI